MMAAFAANSVFGASPSGVADRVGSPKAGVDDLEVRFSFSSFASAVTADGLDPPIGNAGSTFTGIIMTFLNDVKKSFLAACLLMPDMKYDSVCASCSERLLSQAVTSSVDR